MAHSEGTADSAVRDLLFLGMVLQWVNLEEVDYLRWKINSLHKSVLGCFLVLFTCLFLESS